jgi:hypothetical protein
MNHNMNDPRHPWTRLTAAARNARDERDSSAPYGFATRVAALAMAQEARVVSLIDRFAFRALGVASLLAICSVALNYEVLAPTVVPAPAQVATGSSYEEADLAPTDDAVAIVLGLAD